VRDAVAGGADAVAAEDHDGAQKRVAGAVGAVGVVRAGPDIGGRVAVKRERGTG
jgi:hypothetical protein